MLTAGNYVSYRLNPVFFFSKKRAQGHCLPLLIPSKKNATSVVVLFGRGKISHQRDTKQTKKKPIEFFKLARDRKRGNRSCTMLMLQLKGNLKMQHVEIFGIS